MNIIQVFVYVIGGGIALAPVIGMIISTRLFSSQAARQPILASLMQP